MTPAKGFAEMKDSGIEWIGEIPATWDVFPAGGVFDEVKEKNVNNQYSNPFSFRYGEIVDKKIAGEIDESVEETLSAYRVVSPNTIMINGLNLNYDFISQRVAIVREKGIITSAYLAVQPDEGRIVPRFVLYLLKAYDYRQVFHGIGSGIRKTLKFQDFKSIKIVAPSLTEQSAIASYLDAQCAKIDEIIAQAKASIEDYKQWKTSIVDECISQVLTSSPQVRLKFLMTDIVDCPHETPEYCLDGNYLVIRTADQDYGFLRPDDFMYRLNEVEFQRRSRLLSLEKNDIVYGREGERWGLACLVPESGKYCLGQRIMQFRCKVDRILPQYAMWALNSRHVYLQGIVDTLGSTSPHVNISTIRNYYIPLPPITEQRRLSTYLFEECGSINTIIKAKQSLIEDLESYKKSLIYEVVTGKRSVRQ